LDLSCFLPRRLGWWEDEADVISPQREMKALASIEEQCVRVSLEQTQGGEPVPQVRLLERLPLSFSATGHPHPINGKGLLFYKKIPSKYEWKRQERLLNPRQLAQGI